MTDNRLPTHETDVEIGPFTLESGVVLPRVIQRVTYYGVAPRPDGKNVVYVAHALTGSGRARDWWDGFVGPGQAIDTERLAVVGINVLGSCYGSTGPASLATDGRPYGSRFPVITVRDMVRAQAKALGQVGIGPMAAIAGGSLGAMQALQWIMDEPERFAHGLLLGAYDSYHAMSIALSTLSRTAIRQDEHFYGGDYYDQPLKPNLGLSLARMIAMVTYKSPELFDERFGRRPDRAGGNPTVDPRAKFDVEGYLEYQGRKFVERMDANAYLSLMRSMDLFHVQDLPTPQNHVTKLTFVGIDSDWRCPATLIEAAAQRFCGRGYETRYLELHSTHGHDAFLADLDDLTELTRESLAPIYVE